MARIERKNFIIADWNKFEKLNGDYFVKTLLGDTNGDFIDSSNPLPVTSVSHTSKDLYGLGPVTIGLTAVELIFTGTTESIIITAGPTNLGLIYVGKSNILSDGSNAVTFLYPGESFTIDYNDVNNSLYAVADTTAQTIISGAAL